MSGIVGRTYLERGISVQVLTQWATPHSPPGAVSWHLPQKRTAPRNVLIERPDGSRVVRPFRGLRREAS